MHELIEKIKEVLKNERRYREAKIKLLSSNEVTEKLSIFRTYLEKRIMYKKNFPKPIQPVRGSHKRWLEHEIDGYILGKKGGE